jgi:HD-GYP domain-containing protein (c-di-GMP phosphodiesterase class II)
LESVRQAGRQFDPQVVEAFVAIWPHLVLESETSRTTPLFATASVKPEVSSS